MSGVRTTGRRKESNTMRIRDEIRQRKQTRREEGRRWEHWRLCTPGYTPEQCICSMPQKRFNWAVSIYSGYDPPVRFGKANVHQESGIHVHDKLGSGNTTSNRSTHSQNHHAGIQLQYAYGFIVVLDSNFDTTLRLDVGCSKTSFAPGPPYLPSYSVSIEMQGTALRACTPGYWHNKRLGSGARQTILYRSLCIPSLSIAFYPWWQRLQSTCIIAWSHR
jgi:hypothetical protein